MLTITGDKSNVDYENMPLMDIVRGNAMDVFFTLRIYEILKEELEEKGVLQFYETVITKAITTYAKMEYTGLDVSRDVLKTLETSIDSELEDFDDDIFRLRKVKKISKENDNELNLNSSKQLAYVLYSEDGYDLVPPDYTDGGDPGTSAGVLKFLLKNIKAQLSNYEE